MGGGCSRVSIELVLVTDYERYSKRLHTEILG